MPFTSDLYWYSSNSYQGYVPSYSVAGGWSMNQIQGSPTTTTTTYSVPVVSSSTSAPVQLHLDGKETYGKIIPVTGGTRRVLGEYLWMKVSSAGIMNCAIVFGKPADSAGTNTYTKLWANGGKLYDTTGPLNPLGLTGITWYQGTETQMPDPTIQADYGAGRTPGYRGLMYAVIKGLDIGHYFGGTPPSIEAEIVDSGGTTWTVAELIKFFGRMGGYSNSDMSPDATLTETAIGPYVVENTTCKEAWLALGRCYGFDVVDGGTTIRFVKTVDGSSYTVSKTITEDDLILPASASAITLTRADEQTVQANLVLQYVDSTQPWRFSLRPARRIIDPYQSTLANTTDNLKVQIILDASTAQTLAARALYREDTGRVGDKFALPWKHIDVEPGDILDVPFGDSTDTVKVTRADLQADLSMSIQAIRINTKLNYNGNADAGTLDDYTLGDSSSPGVLPTGGETWATSPLNTAIVLSNSDRTATAAADYTAGGYFGGNCVRAVHGVTSGQYYAEFEVDFDATQGCGVGLCSASFDPTTGSGLGSGTAGIMADAAGIVEHASVNGIHYTGTVTAGRICVAVDIDGNRIWFRLNNNDWNGSSSADPETATGATGFSLTGLLPYYLAGQINATNRAIILRTDPAEWLYAAPAGFGAWPTS